MAWLRIDDGFTSHPKIVALGTTDRRWTWLQVLTYACRYRRPNIPAGIQDVIPKATPKFLADCLKVGLLDESKDGLVVHDWRIYNGETIAEKAAAYLEKNPQATANEVHRAIGGKRELVLAIVAQHRYLTGTPDGTQTVPGTEANGTPEVPLPVPLARARGPVPSLEELTPLPPTSGGTRKQATNPRAAGTNPRARAKPLQLDQARDFVKRLGHEYPSDTDLRLELGDRWPKLTDAELAGLVEGRAAPAGPSTR